MSVRVLPDFLINQIAAGEVVERPASVVKELVENALDAGADQIMIDVIDGGRTQITITDNGSGMSRDDLARAIKRHATSKLPDDDLLNINFMGFRGEALPSIASVSDMTIDTCNGMDENGWKINATTGEIMPSDWEAGTRIRVQNLFAKTPARLKFLRGDRAEMMSVLDVVKRLAMARADVGFVLNNKWRFQKDEDLMDRIVAVMGDDVQGRMLEIDAVSSSSNMKLTGFISEPTLRRASSVDQFLFVNGRPVKDKVLVGALRAAYMDVMHAREFPLCALYLTLPTNAVDVNVSPAKTDVHFLEPNHVRAFIVKTLRNRLSQTLMSPGVPSQPIANSGNNFARQSGYGGASNFRMENRTAPVKFDFGIKSDLNAVRDVLFPFMPNDNSRNADTQKSVIDDTVVIDLPLGRVVGQVGNKYIVAQKDDNMVIVDQHAAHERITYEKLRNNKMKTQPLLTPIVVNMRIEEVQAIVSIADDLRKSGLVVDAFGDGAIAIFEKPADWDLDWQNLLQAVADEVRVNGHSSQLNEKLHLKLANYACHHSVRAGQKLDMLQMDMLLRDIEQTERGGQCNHGRPVYKFIPMTEIDTWFERL
ncbi:MAG: DNA mismatch repair endonuclease MutL [Alphaproteobacteria bacterium]|nr:DNA mismatch repair endonuclease MutL [Alphaproteobacteria bacterium]